MSWLDELEVELGRVGIRGRSRRRIRAELADHLAIDPGSEARLGVPKQVAEHFAAELGSVRTKRSAYGSFAALALAAVGLLATVKAYSAAGGWPNVHGLRGDLVGLTGLGILFASQVAFAAGMLGIARALRIRQLAAPPAAELRLVQRRMAVATIAAAVSGACLLVHVGALWGRMPGWWDATALTATALPLLGLAASLGAVGAARRLTPDDGQEPEGIAADLPDRLAPYLGPVFDRPWRLAVVVGIAASAAMLAVTAQAERSVVEGLIRAVLEGFVFVGCFALLGRLLGIRR